MKVVQFGTFDVFNYGDLLFPLISKYRLKSIENLELLYVSPKGGEPVVTDSVKTISLEDLVEEEKAFNAILIGGGNIIHHNPTLLKDYSSHREMCFGYSDLWIGASSIISSKATLIWNGPGVVEQFSRKYYGMIKHALARADYVAVRDSASSKFLLEILPDCDVNVIPDTAWDVPAVFDWQAISDVYEEFLSKESIDPVQKTVVFHVNVRYARDLSIKELAHCLDQIAIKKNLRPILLPLGLCHEDAIIAEQVADMMTSDSVCVKRPESLIQIVSILANCNLYIGSSMHGFVTASAYGRPAIIVASEKLKFIGLAADLDVKVVESSWLDVERAIQKLDLSIIAEKLSNHAYNCRCKLDKHWEKVTELVKNSSQEAPSSKELNAYRQKVNEALLSDTITKLNNQNKLTKKLHKNLSFEKKNSISLEGSIKGQNKLINTLKEELKQISSKELLIRKKMAVMTNTVSWKATKPLRVFSHYFPKTSTHIKASMKYFISRYRKIVSDVIQSNVTTDGQTKVLPLRLKAITTINISPETVGQIKSYHKNKKKNNKIVVYTALYGGYDRLMPPSIINPNIDYVCFSDSALETYGVWDLLESPYYHPDPTRMARYVKLHPHYLLGNYEVVIWMDANIAANNDLKKYIEKVYLSGTALGLVEHPHRDCFFEEAEACMSQGKDDVKIIKRQVEEYRRIKIPENKGMYETGFFIVNMIKPNIRKFFAIWWRELDNYSRRDQLGVVRAIIESEISFSHIMKGGLTVRDSADFVYLMHNISRKTLVKGVANEDRMLRKPKVNLPRKRIKTEINKFDKVDIIICVYNALDDVSLCLKSVKEELEEGQRIIIVNDCSDIDTTNFLRSFAMGSEHIYLHENTQNLGYIESANIGLKLSSADISIMLNSDTIVSSGWARKMAEVAFSSTSVGIVGPLSNAAAAQSIPSIRGRQGQTAINDIPKGVSLGEINVACEELASNGIYPVVPLVHGFCFGIKRSVIEEIGYFDAENFNRYYGEENDYCFRARRAGFEFLIASNTFVYHRKSRSIEEEERITHMGMAGKKLRELYGKEAVITACVQVEKNQIMTRVRQTMKPLLAPHKWPKQA